MKKLTLFLFVFSSAILFHFSAPAEYLQGKIGSLQINVPPGDYEVGVYLMYEKMDKNKTDSCDMFSVDHAVKGSEQSLYAVAAADGSISLPQTMGGRPSSQEFECWSAMILVRQKGEDIKHIKDTVVTTAGVFFESYPDTIVSSEGLYFKEHPEEDPTNSKDAYSLSILQEFLDSKTRVVIFPKIKINLTKARKTPGKDRSEYIIYVTTKASTEHEYFQSYQYALPSDTLQMDFDLRTRYQVFREPLSAIELTGYSVVGDFDNYHKLIKKCVSSDKKSLDPAKIPETMELNANLDCEPQPLSN